MKICVKKVGAKPVPDSSPSFRIKPKTKQGVRDSKNCFGDFAGQWRNEANKIHYQTTSQIVGEFRKLLRAQTREQKRELRKSLLESLARERRKLN
jgi:hypothetical protein